jgi:hypothetical protein
MVAAPIRMPVLRWDEVSSKHLVLKKDALTMVADERFLRCAPTLKSSELRSILIA